ncbi:MAG TPA: VOC family protein [Puia sp.]|nr:VOC family protein [Puia sp.]
MQKVTGIGGVFIKAQDPKSLAAWYEKHLGVEFGSQTYVGFDWINHNNPGKTGSTAFSFFKESSTYFQPSEKTVMINFRVKNLDALLEELKKENVEIVGEPQQYEYGKFGWIMDPEGNKIELWEPVD